MNWTPEKVRLLFTLRAANWTYDDIAARLNISRGAVAGKLHRVRKGML